MNEQLKIWLADNKDMKEVNDKHSDVLMWAHKEGYIVLKKFEGKFYYNEMMLEIATMWAEKEGKSFNA